jgi:hypothetical protein
VSYSNFIGINCYDGQLYDFKLTGLTGSSIFNTGTTFSIQGYVEDGREIETCVEIYDTYTASTYSDTGITIQDTFYLDDPIIFTEYTGINECTNCSEDIGNEILPSNLTPTPTQTPTPTPTPSPAICDFEINYTGTSKCSNTGRATINNVTGVGPYTFIWDESFTGTVINNLSKGIHIVTMQDAGSSCGTITKSIDLPYVDDLGVENVIKSRSNCFGCDAYIDLTISGGTPPYSYSASTGQISGGFISSDNFVVTGLCQGNVYINITDNGGCSINHREYVESNAQIKIISINKNESKCSDLGDISIATSNYIGSRTYTLSADTTLIDSVTTTNPNHKFSDLSSGEYYIGISVYGTDCNYISDVIELNNTEKFIVNTSTTGTTCNNNNGVINVEVLSGSTELKYPFDYILTRTLDGEVMYQNDLNGCTITTTIDVTGTTGVSASAYGYGCETEREGEVEVIIHDGQEPYTITWYDNAGVIINTGSTIVTGLSVGSYYVSVSDYNECDIVRRADITCTQKAITSNYAITNVCEEYFTRETNSRRTFQMMLSDALNDYSTNAVPEGSYNATFTAILEISGPGLSTDINLQEIFHTCTSLNSVPTESQWQQVVDDLISQVNGLDSYDVDTDTYSMTSDCDNEQFNGAFVQLKLNIEIKSNDIEVNGSDGVYEREFDLGSYTGPVTIVFNSFNVPDRFIIEYNEEVVADSLFVGDHLSGSNASFYNALITIPTTRTVYTWNVLTSTFEDNGTIDTNYGPSDIASSTDDRSGGSVGNQVGVVANYPSSSSLASDGNIKLTFTKTTQYPTTIKVTAIGISSTDWTMSFE